MSPIKQKIKDLSAEQVSLKNQRRTVRLVGERTMSPYQATYKHGMNRSELSFLFIAYAIIRGKDPALANADYPNMGKGNIDWINKLVDQYTALYEAQKESDLRAREQAA